MIRKPDKPCSTYVLIAIEKIKQHIDQNPLQFKTSSELLDHLNTPNRNSMEKTFKNIYGAGIKAYQVKQRLETSKNFLEKGMTKKLVAAKCYYKSPSTFAAAFKKAFKMTPTEWQALFVS